MTEALKIAISGMNDAVLRIVNVASNVVNALSTGRLPGSPGEKATSYQPQDVVTLSDSVGDNAMGVTSSLKPREPAYVTAPDPHSPHANAEGLVAAPNVDIATEMVSAKIAETAYKANAAVIKTERDMEKELLDTLA